MISSPRQQQKKAAASSNLASAGSRRPAECEAWWPVDHTTGERPALFSFFFFLTVLSFERPSPILLISPHGVGAQDVNSVLPCLAKNEASFAVHPSQN